MSKCDGVLPEHKDILHGTEEELQEELKEENDHTKLIRKILLVIIGLFLIFLMLSYIGPGEWLFPFIAGRIESHQLDDDFSIQLNNITIAFHPPLYQELKQHYYAEQEKEFKVCLLGKKYGEKQDGARDGVQDELQRGAQGEVLHLTAAVFPTMYAQSFNSVTSAPCPEGTLVALHTHPKDSCIFSEQDILSFEAAKRTSPNIIIGLMCNVDRFSFYGG